jgi:outer membrane protein TolC
LPEIQVAQAVQDSLSAKDNWLNLSQSYARELDAFKLQLGLPPDALIRLDFNELQKLASKGFQGISSGLAMVFDEDPDHLFLSPGDEQDEFFLQDRYWLEKALKNRLDLNISEGEVVDAQRKLDIAANDFLPELDLKMEAYVGESRSYGSWDLDDAELRFDRGQYALGLSLNSPFNKTPERIAYRRRLLDLGQAIRNYQRAEDTIKLEVRNELRNLAEFQEQVKIQERALEVAEWRVGATEMLLQSGRIEMRDLLDARDSLVLASDNLTDAKLNYKLSELELLRGAGILKIDNQGLVVNPQASEVQDQ